MTDGLVTKNTFKMQQDSFDKKRKFGYGVATQI